MRGRSRRRAYRLGRHAEALSAWRLRLAGYRILARGYRGRGGEIDIVARRGDTLVMVEVKARPSLDEAAAAVTPRQRERIVRATGQFLAQHPRLAGLAVRFDAMLIAPGRLPRHLVGAWRVEQGRLNR